MTTQIGDGSGLPSAPLPPSAPHSLLHSLRPSPPHPRPPPVPVCVWHRQGDPGSSPGSARGGATAALAAERRGAAAALRLPGLSKWGQSSRSRSRQLEGKGKRDLQTPPQRLLSTPFWPLPLEKVECCARLSYFFRQLRGARSQRLPCGALRCWRASVCGSPRHTSVDDEERSAGDSGPLRTGTGIRAANACATCPGPAQRQRHRLGRSR